MEIRQWEAQARVMTTTPPESPTEPRTDGGPRASRAEISDLGRLRRSRADRKIAGVAGGLARHLDIDPLIVRVAFVVLIFFGGAGLILYAAGWLLLPDDVGGPAPVNLDERSRSAVLIIVGVLALLALLGDAWGGYGPPWPLAVIGIVAVVVLTMRGSSSAARPVQAPDPGQIPANAYAAPPTSEPRGASLHRARDVRRRGPILFWFTLALIVFSEGVLGIVDVAGAAVADSAYAALALGLIGLMLVVGSFFGRAGGLILAGLLATVILTAATISDRWDGDTMRETPAEASAVLPAYRIEAGELVLDLRDVTDLQNLDGRTISVAGDVGHLQVILPRELDVRVDAEVTGAGEIEVFDDSTDGIELGLDRSYDGGDDVPAVTINAELALGYVEVTH